ncbi:MAG: hypothetical protein H7255_08230 [Ramlibacter sp.]|nr:hypothetical protein [Ramlibacter sp.]
MRFAAIKVPKDQEPKRTSAGEMFRRIVSGESQARTQPAEVRTQDLPAELDQRVRLVGEW